MLSVKHCDQLTRGRGRGSWSLCRLSCIVITSLEDEGSCRCVSFLHCDHLTSGRGSWSLCCLSSIVIRSLGEERAGRCDVCIVITALGDDGAGRCAVCLAL